MLRVPGICLPPVLVATRSPPHAARVGEFGVQQGALPLCSLSFLLLVFRVCVLARRSGIPRVNPTPPGFSLCEVLDSGAPGCSVVAVCLCCCWLLLLGLLSVPLVHPVRPSSSPACSPASCAVCVLVLLLCPRCLLLPLSCWPSPRLPSPPLLLVPAAALLCSSCFLRGPRPSVRLVPLLWADRCLSVVQSAGTDSRAIRI